MQSSTLVIFRTFVMFACLVAAPAVAILGGASWQDIEHALEKLRPAKESPAPRAPAAISAPPTAAPHVGIPSGPPGAFPQSLSPAAEVAPSKVAVGIAALPAPETAVEIESPPLPTPPFWPDQTASLADRLAGAAQPATAANSPGNLDVIAREDRVVPVSFETPQADRPNPLAPPTPGQLNERIQQQLKSMGAQHYRLLSWGPEGKQFKFECKMSLDSNPRYVRFFQAVGDNQQDAMQGVLDQVEAWHRSMNRD